LDGKLTGAAINELGGGAGRRCKVVHPARRLTNAKVCIFLNTALGPYKALAIKLLKPPQICQMWIEKHYAAILVMSSEP
jgi:hypothetical protein